MKVNLYFIIFIFSIKSIDSQKSPIHKKSAINTNGPSFQSWDFSTTIRLNSKNKNTLQTKKSDRRETNFFHKRKSQEMCEQYAKMSKIGIWVQYPTNYDPIPITLLNCDRHHLIGLINPLIAGGENALFGEIPHMAILAYRESNDKINYACAASLISEKWILTSAHCSYKIFIKTAIVYLGSNRLMDSNNAQVINVKRLIIHPEFRPRYSYADIALIELEEEVQFGLHLKPACLHVDDSVDVTKLLASGWGTSYYGGDLNEYLLKTQLDVIENNYCSTIYKNSTNLPWGIDDSFICAGDLTGNWKKDTCTGDSGSPLQNRHPNNCLYNIVGITSSGKFCGIDKIPGIYTRVAAYVDWIEEIVWPDHEINNKKPSRGLERKAPLRTNSKSNALPTTPLKFVQIT
ncbi:serine protease snake-like [Leptopilina boulardi]|uniref:serine protease snake-like n=1 Tax=Leptopilina boulardi TaxID=63433 RepID=UPI0021F67F91|nr:serine protease snake-like [Leptopilina boulardi]